MTFITVLLRLLSRLTNSNTKASRFALILAMLFITLSFQEPVQAGWCIIC